MITISLEGEWNNRLATEMEKAYFQDLLLFLAIQKQREVIFPPEEFLFNALAKTPFERIKVVILGQDPYHQPGQAHGLAFSVPEGIRIPPSLRNIFKELHQDMEDFHIPRHGDLTAWANQGVLLLNATMTVQAGKPGSHQKMGWEIFTDEMIRQISQYKEKVVFLLWGKYAQQKVPLIDESKHEILKAPHPSPLSAYQGFLGCRHFSLTNERLLGWGMAPIDWRLD